MEFTIDLLISKSDISKVGLSEMLIEWGGEFLSQIPPKYKNKLGLVFEEFVNPNDYINYYSCFLENDFDIDKYIILRLLGTHIFDLGLIVNNSCSDISKNVVISFLHELAELKSFAIFFIRDEEYIDIRKKVNTEDEIIKIICSSLNWDSPKGVLITKNFD